MQQSRKFIMLVISFIIIVTNCRVNIIIPYLVDFFKENSPYIQKTEGG